MLIAALLSSLTFAADLDVSVQLNDAAPVSATLHDVLSSSVPDLAVVDDEGQQRLLHFEVTQLDNGTYQVATVISHFEPDCRGRLAMVEDSRPRVVTLPGEEAEFKLGQRIPYKTDDGQIAFQERSVTIRALVVE